MDSLTDVCQDYHIHSFLPRRIIPTTRQNTHISMKSISLFQKLLKAKGLGPDCISRAPAAILDLGTALQAYILDACTKLLPNPASRKVNSQVNFSAEL